jgi:hemerythrin-like domain-containing protein
MTMNTIIHAAFRRDLRRFAAALDSFPTGSVARAADLLRAWRNFEHQLRHHHQDEETIFWPVLRRHGADQALVDDLDGEHEAMVAALDTASAAMTSFGTDPTAGRAASARAAVEALRDVLERHLAHEERDLEPISNSLDDTPDMKAAKKAVQKAFRGETGTFVAWLSDGADEGALAGLRNEMPPPVLWVMRTVGGRHYQRSIAPTWR